MRTALFIGAFLSVNLAYATPESSAGSPNCTAELKKMLSKIQMDQGTQKELLNVLGDQVTDASELKFFKTASTKPLAKIRSFDVKNTKSQNFVVERPDASTFSVRLERDYDRSVIRITDQKNKIEQVMTMNEGDEGCEPEAWLSSENAGEAKQSYKLLAQRELCVTDAKVDQVVKEVTRVMGQTARVSCHGDLIRSKTCTDWIKTQKAECANYGKSGTSASMTSEHSMGAHHKSLGWPDKPAHGRGSGSAGSK